MCADALDMPVANVAEIQFFAFIFNQAFFCVEFLVHALLKLLNLFISAVELVCILILTRNPNSIFTSISKPEGDVRA